MEECTPLNLGTLFHYIVKKDQAVEAGAYTRPLFGSTSAHFVRYVGGMIVPQSVRQGDPTRRDQNG